MLQQNPQSRISWSELNIILERFRNQPQQVQFKSSFQTDQSAGFQQQYQNGQISHYESQVQGYKDQPLSNLNYKKTEGHESPYKGSYQSYQQYQPAEGSVVHNYSNANAQQGLYTSNMRFAEGGQVLTEQGGVMARQGGILSPQSQLIRPQGAQFIGQQQGVLLGPEQGGLVQRNNGFDQSIVLEQTRGFNGQQMVGVQPPRVLEPQGRIVEQQGRFIEPQQRFIEPQQRFIETQQRIVEPQQRIVEPQQRIVEQQQRIVEPQQRFFDQRFIEQQQRIIEPQQRFIEQPRLIEPQQTYIEQQRVIEPQHRLIEQPRILETQPRYIEQQNIQEINYVPQQGYYNAGVYPSSSYYQNVTKAQQLMTGQPNQGFVSYEQYNQQPMGTGYQEVGPQDGWNAGSDLDKRIQDALKASEETLKRNQEYLQRANGKYYYFCF